MKKVSGILVIIFFCCHAFAQVTVQASIGAGSQPNSVYIYLKPSGPVSAATGAISTLQYSIALPVGTFPVPTLTILSQPLLGGYTVDGPRVTDGFLVYNLTTPNSAVANIPAAETQVMEVQFSNGGTIPSNVSLITLPGGGSYDGNALYYFTSVGANSVEGQLYYARPGTSVVNNASYTGPLASTATITGVLLPVKFTDFTAVKQNKDGFLNWSLGNLDLPINHFEIERSTNGVDFVKIGSTPANTTTTLAASYSYTDINIDALKIPIVYYRIKSIDNNGVPVYTDIRSIRLNNKQISMNLYPNPARTVTTLTYDLVDASNIQIVITDESGREMMKAQAAGFKGSNMQKLDVSGFAAGKYLLTVRSSTATATVSFVKSN